MDRILLVRHARADGHDESDPGLGELGLRQAEALAEQLAGEDVVAILNSPRLRARQTAELVAQRIGCSVRTTDLLEDRTPVPSARRWDDYPPHRWERLREVPAEERDEDGVALSAAWSRITAPDAADGDADGAADDLTGGGHVADIGTGAVGGSASTLVLVTHAFVVGWFVCRALSAPPAAWMLLPVDNASITELQARPKGEHAVVRFNDVGHLSER